MKAEIIDRILEILAPTGKKSSSYELPEELEATVLIALPSETLTIAHVIRIERQGESSMIESAQGECYYVATESIAACKIITPKKRGVGRSAGFR